MVWGQRYIAIWIVTFTAKFFRLFFLHGKKSQMILIGGEFSRGLVRGVPQKEKHTSAKGHKKQVQPDCLFFS